LGARAVGVVAAEDVLAEDPAFVSVPFRPHAQDASAIPRTSGQRAGAGNAAFLAS
jgi:hypothetical protein